VVPHIRKILRFVKPYWVFVLLSFITLTIAALADLSIPRLTQQIIDKGIAPHDQGVVIRTTLLMVGISLLSLLVLLANNFLSIRTGEGVARDLRDALFTKIQSLSYGNLDRFPTGLLMVRLSSDSAAVMRAVQVTLRIGSRAPMMMIGSLILMFNTDRALALSILPLLLVTSVIIVFFSIKMEPLFRTVQQRMDKLNTVLQENISGVRLVKAFVRAAFEGQRFEEVNEDFTHRTIRVSQFMTVMGPLLGVLVNLGMVLVLYTGGVQAIKGQASVGQIIAFTNYLLSTMGPLTMMTWLSNTWANGLASMRRIDEILDTVPEVQDAPDARMLPAEILGRMELKNVSFHYNGETDANVLCGINLVAEPGQTVAILGATGAGKTSLINLIPRFYDPTSGQVFLDGMDLRELRQDAFLGNVGLVPQESVLFSGTVRDNIRYARPEASEEEVVAAAQAAQAHDFILRLPEGYDSRVEERGVNLSGGQKQRIAIARALIARPRILILDDSTSSVDVETETRIQNALRSWTQHTTTFVVAQRISTVLNADKIIVIDKGDIAAMGTHTELLAGSDIYREIYDSQLGAGPNGKNGANGSNGQAGSNGRAALQGQLAEEVR
jgi:ATP-binding cassette, subfamily B, multidrug efflux pump